MSYSKIYEAGKEQNEEEFIEHNLDLTNWNEVLKGAVLSGQRERVHQLMLKGADKTAIPTLADDALHISSNDRIKQLQYLASCPYKLIPKIISLFRKDSRFTFQDTTESNAIAIAKAMHYQGLSWPEAYVLTNKSDEGARLLMMLLLLHQDSSFMKNLPLNIWSQIFNACTAFPLNDSWKNVGISQAFSYMAIAPASRINSGFYERISKKNGFIALQEANFYRQKLIEVAEVPTHLLYPSLAFKSLYKTQKKYAVITAPKLLREPWQIEALSGNIAWFLYENRQEDITRYKDRKGAHLLHYTAWSGNFSAFRLAYEHLEKHMPEYTCEGLNVVHFAMLSDNIDILNFLFQHKPGLFDKVDMNGYTMAFYPAAFGKIRSLHWIRENKPEQLQTRLSGGNCLAHVAAAYGSRKGIFFIK